MLSESQLATLAEVGEERTAAVGETLFEIGDETYPFIAILEGEARYSTPPGSEIVRHGASGFLGEMNLLSGQTVFLTAVVTEPMRYIAVEREALRELLFEDAPLSDLLLSAFVERRELLQQRAGDRDRDRRPARLGRRPGALVEFARRQRLPYSWREPERERGGGGAVEALDPEELPLVRLPGGAELRRPSNGELSRALGIGLELGAARGGRPAVVGGGPAGLGAAVYGASEGLDTLVIESTVLGGQAGTSRRIENYLGFPAGISGTELTSRAVTQARKFRRPHGDALPGAGARAGRGPPPGQARGRATRSRARAVVLATGAEYRRLPVDDLDEYEGVSVFYAAGPPEAQLCGGQRVGVVGGGNSAGAGGRLAGPRRRPGHPAAPPRRPQPRRCRTT